MIHKVLPYRAPEWARALKYIPSGKLNVSSNTIVAQAIFKISIYA